MDVVINADSPGVPAHAKVLTTQGHWLLNALVALGYDAQTLPWADFLRQWHRLSGKWVVAEPIYWEATHNDAMMMSGGDALPLTDAQSKAWMEAIATFLQEDGLVFHYHDRGTWLMHVEGKPLFKCGSSHSMHHQSMMPVLSQLDPGLYWLRLITELQMFLSTHPLKAINDPSFPVNGVWFSDGGPFIFNGQKTILTDDHTLLAAFPDQIHPLSFESPLENTTILLIRDPQSLRLDCLNGFPVRWFWNNSAYLTPKQNWWRRFFRGNTHAYQTKDSP